jgi:phospholipid/cholesterol/gamma-HCH transport system ATP-binding protein
MSNIQEPIIRVENLTAAYGGTVIIDNISFDVHKGEVFVILGGSGCGKSTLMKQMIGLYRPASGKILINGQDIVSAEGDERLSILRKIGVSYQSSALFGSMTLHENVRLPLEEFTDLNPSAMDLIVLMKLKLVGLKGSENRMPSELSGGMQKRAAIARAMALDPQIIFLDEPSAGLARNLKITFVIVTHELPSIYTVADKVIMLDKRVKRIVAEGKPQDLRDHSDNLWVRQFFNREASSNVS